jgi:hypothetical protein
MKYLRIDKTYFNQLVRTFSRPPTSVATTLFITGSSSVENHQREKLDRRVVFIFGFFDVYFVWNEIANFSQIIVIVWIIQVEKTRT